MKLSHGHIIQIDFLYYRIELVYVETSDSTEQDYLELDITQITPTPDVYATTVPGYTLTAAFDAGSRGAVSICTSPRTGDRFVCKRIMTPNAEQHAADVREVRMLRPCNNSNIVKLHEHYVPDPPNIPGRPPTIIRERYLVLQPVLRITLLNLIQSSRGSMFAVRRSTSAHAILSQMAPAVSYLHDEVGIMHNDIKPDNIGIHDAGRQQNYYIFDFDHADFCKTSDDHMKGTIRYLSNEDLGLEYRRTAQPFSFAADVFSLGLTTAEHIMGILTRDEHHTQQFRSELTDYMQEALSPRFRRLVLEMLNPDLGMRPKMLIVERRHNASATGQFLRMPFSS